MSGSTTDILALLRETTATQLVGADFTLIDRHIRWALHEFLTRARLLRETLAITTAPGVASYVLPITTPDGIVSTLLTAFNGDQRVGFSSLVGLPPAEATPTLCGMLDGRTLGVWPTPAASAPNVTLSLLAAVTVSPNTSAALAVPYVCQPWFDTLLSGVLGRMHAMPDKPWTSQTLAAFHIGEFRRGAKRARQTVDNGRAMGTQMWRFPRFGR